MTTGARTHSGLRILFAMQYPGYLRYYDSTIRLLAARGHDVVLAFENPGKQAEGLCAVAGVERVNIRDQFVEWSRFWTAVPRGLRWITDWVRYLDPRFADAHYLRRRAADHLPAWLQPFTRIETLDPRISRLALKVLIALDRCIPAYREMREYLNEVGPDVVVLTPLVTGGSRQADLVRGGQALGIPVVHAVASWDHLTTKGVIRAQPDVVVLWNDVQRREAEELHDVPAERIVVTGAQAWDRWFEREPTTGADDFRARVGLPPAKPFILFVGSTASISAPAAEVEFVREWIAALRAAEDPIVRDLAVLVRPHPYNPGLWGDVDLSDLGNVAVFPRGGANPVDEDDRAVYFDSMYHSVGVVGVNTSAMIESAIVGRPVFTVRTSRFSYSQSGTIHFTYLLPENGGFVRTSNSLVEHVRQLADVLQNPERTRVETERFLRSFVRPHGLDVPATPIVADVIEHAARARHEPVRMPVWRYPGRILLWSVAAVAVAARGGVLGRAFLFAAPRGRQAAERLARVVGQSSEAVAALGGRVEPASFAAARFGERGAGAARRLHHLGERLERKLKNRGIAMHTNARLRAQARKERARVRKERLIQARAVPHGHTAVAPNDEETRAA